jgi:hypothetical protein
MARLAVFLAALTLGTAPAQAAWIPYAEDNGGIFIAGASPKGTSFSLYCANRSRQGLGLMETGSHETTLTDPGTLALNFGNDLVPIPPNQWQRSDVVIWADGTGYRLPTARWNELNANGWETSIGIADPLVLSLFSASQVIIGAEAGPHYQLDTTDMAKALTDTVQFCLSEYHRMGQPVPTALQGLMPSPPPAPSGAFQIPAKVTADITAKACSGGPVAINPAAFQAGDLDHDGAPDVVVHYGDVTCPNERINPNCGAANCSIDVYISTRSYTRPFGLLGTGVGIVPHSTGRLALKISGTYGLCGVSDCDTPWFWTGTTFEQIP